MVTEEANNRNDCGRNDQIDSRSSAVKYSTKKTITSPIYYVNGKPHIGHLYTSIAVDILRRFAVICKQSVYTSFGVDEHGQKVENAAKEAGLNPQEYTNSACLPFIDILNKAQVKYDCFIRTTNSNHKEVALHIWGKLYESGMMYEGEYEGWYSKSDEAFYKEEEVENGISKVTGATVEWLSEKCVFFKLSSMRDKLIEHYKNSPDSIKPKSRYNEVLGMLSEQLPDLAVSRSRFQWGIPVADNQVMYVWVDALSNYLTAIGYPKNPNYTQWWSEVIHIIGKDILKFHAVYWPALLFACNLTPPKRIFAHGWWKVNDTKMSKSIGNTIDPFELIERYGIDTVRYYLFRAVRFGSDGVFAYEEVDKIYNTELVNEIGNLVQRVLTLSCNHFGSTLDSLPMNTLSDRDRWILSQWDSTFDDGVNMMEDQEITNYILTIREVITKTNRYIDEVKPWVNPSREIIGTLCLCIQRMTILLWPIMPDKSEQVACMIGLRHITVHDSWNKHTSFPIQKPSPLFLRLPNIG